METIQTFSKASLDNALHYSFMSEVLTVAISQDLPDQKALDATTALRTAYMKEDELFKISTASDLTPEIVAADLARDEAYTHLKVIVNEWAKTDYKPQGPSARKIKKVLDLYKLDVRMNQERETGIIKNIVSDLTTEDMLKALEDMKLTEVFNDMLLNNSTVESKTLERREEHSLVEIGALKNARKATDEAYDYWVKVIEGSVVLSDTPEVYVTTINRVNETIDDYRTKLKQEATRRANLKKKEEETEPTEPTESTEPTTPTEPTE